MVISMVFLITFNRKKYLGYISDSIEVSIEVNMYYVQLHN